FLIELQVDHAAPNDEVRHVGDLGNIEANEYGVVDTMLTDHVISLSGKRAVIGRGIVIHSDADDLGKTNHPDSKKTGNAGSRVACGIIGINSDMDEWPCRDGGANAIGLSVSLLSIIVATMLSRLI
ncbi:extracellular superoxide dismutase [Cu-Zn]-like, partial [Teleopsis dalmanni]|uniref:extracellular superoxide dismutase [Cu-Zn]-like n=1 Tax=Teleopsis dalmanni TaxID=139649 RepID=UPI0018CE86C6